MFGRKFSELMYSSNDRISQTHFPALSGKKKEKTGQILQTGEHAWQTVFNNTFNESSDVQEGEFVLFEINKFKFLCYSITVGDQIGRWDT